MTRARGPLMLVARVLVAAGVAALVYATYVVVDARAYQAREWRRFEATRTSSIAMAPLTDGDVIGQLAIARLDMAVMIAQGDSEKVLRRAVGHLAFTPLPGQGGNIVLAGHRDTIFRPLRRVAVGDVIKLTTRDGDFEYRVESFRVVPPSDLQPLDKTTTPTLTLITCFPFSYVGAAPNRFVVRARETRPASVR